MLCPDVWNLPVPKYNYEAFEANSSLIERKISSGNFSEYITIVFPGDFPRPVSAEKVLLGSDSYILRQLPLRELLEPEFIEAFVKRGEFNALSLNQQTESECSVAVTSNGILSIAVNKDAFESIQLTGKPIQTSRKSKDRYLCEINLRDAALLKTTEKRKIILRALESKHIPPVDLQITWVADSTKFCPSSIAMYFDRRNATVELCETKKVHKEVFPGKVPSMINKEDGESKEDFDEKVVDFLEFLGLLVLDCPIVEDDYLTSYGYSGPMEDAGKVTVIKWKGFFTKYMLIKVMNYLRVYMREFPNVPWVALNVERTQKTPFGDAFSDGTFNIAHDNSCTIILSPRKPFIWHQILPIQKKF